MSSQGSGGIVPNSPGYFAACSLGGIIACGSTHTLITPVDLVKCLKQVNPQGYSSTWAALAAIAKQQGSRGLWLGGSPTAIGYSLQGACKFGFYELFKQKFASAVGEEAAHRHRTALYLTASAAAEAIADVALCPFEAVKVRMQTAATPYAPSFSAAVRRYAASEGLPAFWRGIRPLWMRQIPYTMMKFGAFERTVEAIYSHLLPRPKESYGKGQQLAVTFAAGYWAGIFCAVVSHPADTLVSKLNAASTAKGTSLFHLARATGFAGLWRGLATRIFMIGTLTALQWFIYDTWKVYAGLPTSGNKTPSKS